MQYHVFISDEFGHAIVAFQDQSELSSFTMEEHLKGFDSFLEEAHLVPNQSKALAFARWLGRQPGCDLISPMKFDFRNSQGGPTESIRAHFGAGPVPTSMPAESLRSSYR